VGKWLSGKGPENKSGTPPPELRAEWIVWTVEEGGPTMSSFCCLSRTPPGPLEHVIGPPRGTVRETQRGEDVDIAPLWKGPPGFCTWGRRFPPDFLFRLGRESRSRGTNTGAHRPPQKKGNPSLGGSGSGVPGGAASRGIATGCGPPEGTSGRSQIKASGIASGKRCYN